jgi:hypothetical protein
VHKCIKGNHLWVINIHLRLVQRYENWIDDWKRMFFSDDTKIDIFKSIDRSWCWSRGEERVEPQHVHQTVKHGGGSVKIWGCIAVFGAKSIVQN